MLYLTALVVLLALAGTTARMWGRLAPADRLLIILVIAYVAAALFLPPPVWLARWLPSAGVWFYLGVSLGLVGFGLFRAFLATPRPTGYRGLILSAVLVAALPALSVGLFALVWG